MEARNHKAEIEFIEHIQATKEMITVLPGTCRYNLRCSFNAVHDAIEAKEDRIAMCVCMTNGSAFIHFVNVSKKGVFTDNTLGHWSSRENYYLVRYITKQEFFGVNAIFSDFRKEARKQLSLLNRLFSNITF